MQVEKYALEKAIAEAIDEAFIHRSADFVTTEDFENKLENALQTIIGKLTLRFGIGFVAMAVTATGAWYSAMGRIDNNANALQEGGRYTQEEADSRAKAVDAQLTQLREEQVRQYSTIIELLKKQ